MNTNFDASNSMDIFFWDISHDSRNVACYLLWEHVDLCIQSIEQMEKRHKNMVKKFNKIR